MDYDPPNMTFMVFTCEPRQCVNITIVDDTVVESIESIAVTLEGNDTWVILDPADAQVVIHDNDGELLSERVIIFNTLRNMQL